MGLMHIGCAFSRLVAKPLSKLNTEVPNEQRVKIDAIKGGRVFGMTLLSRSIGFWLLHAA